MDTSDDPVTLGLGAVTAYGTIMQADAMREQAESQRGYGQDIEELSRERAAIDLADAEAVERQTRDAVLLEQDRGRKLLKTQKSQFAAANVRVDVGSPLVVAAATRATLLRDIGFIYEHGATQAGRFRSQAAIEIRAGKVAMQQAEDAAKQTEFASIATLGQGLGSLGLDLYGAGAFSGGGGGAGTEIHPGIWEARA